MRKYIQPNIKVIEIKVQKQILVASQFGINDTPIDGGQALSPEFNSDITF